MATQKELIAFNRLMAEVEERLQEERRLHVEYVQVLTAVMKVFDEPNPEKLCGLRLTAEDLLAKLADYPFDAPVVLGSIEAPGLQIPGGMGRIRAALGRGVGEQWKILSHPADPHFPPILAPITRLTT